MLREQATARHSTDVRLLLAGKKRTCAPKEQLINATGSSPMVPSMLSPRAWRIYLRLVRLLAWRKQASDDG